MNDDDLIEAAIYDPANGAITCVFRGRRSALAANIPPGMAAVEGCCSPESDCVNLESGELERLPQQQIDDRVAEANARRTRMAIYAQMRALEEKQARAIREHAIGRGGTPAELKQRLEAIDDQITALRATLNE